LLGQLTDPGRPRTLGIATSGPRVGAWMVCPPTRRGIRTAAPGSCAERRFQDRRRLISEARADNHISQAPSCSGSIHPQPQKLVPAARAWPGFARDFIPTKHRAGGLIWRLLLSTAPHTPPPPRGGRTERHGLSRNSPQCSMPRCSKRRRFIHPGVHRTWKLRRPSANLASPAIGRLSPMAFLVGVIGAMRLSPQPWAPTLAIQECAREGPHPMPRLLRQDRRGAQPSRGRVQPDYDLGR
jgi:hypothetical protein